jgi:DNA-binding transcriptional regulator YhcF (GntR family)/predicted GIY-YIG superfamily endonuclease
MTERTALYRLYDSADQLLYIGIAKNPKARWRGHASSASATWWPRVERKEVEWFPTREVADAAETAAINTERPLYNRAKAQRRSVGWGHWGIRAPEIDRAATHKDPLSHQVARAIRSDIASEKIRPGDRMPTGRELFQRFGVTEATCNLALRRLADEGLCHQPRPHSRYVCSDPAMPSPRSTHTPSPTPVDGDELVYRTFRFAVNRPSKGAEQIRSKMTDEQWAAFVTAVAEINTQPADDRLDPAA